MITIPKLIHISWKTKDIFNSISPIIRYGLNNLVSMNSDWKINFSTDHEVDEYLQTVLGSKEYNIIKNDNIVAKLDIWRLFKIYNEGGLYIDVDRLYNIPLNEILTDDIKCVLPSNADFDFSNDFILSAPQNPICLEAIQLNFQRRWEGHTNLYFLGAQTYMHAVTKVLTGQIINTNPGLEVFEQMRHELLKIPFIKTYREAPPYDTVVCKKEKILQKFDHEIEKRLLYKEFGLKHWTNEW